jgi:hypothetical protein
VLQHYFISLCRYTEREGREAKWILVRNYIAGYLYQENVQILALESQFPNYSFCFRSDEKEDDTYSPHQ